MSSAKKFEDLVCWQESRKLVDLIYKTSRRPQFVDFSLKDQIRRAGVSVLSNIAEGFERGSKEEFIYFLYIAKGSCGEVRAQSYVVLDQKFISPAECMEINDLARMISVMIYRLIENLKVSKFKGLKYKQVEKKEDKEFEKLFSQYAKKF